MQLGPDTLVISIIGYQMGIHSNYLKGDYSLWWSTCYKFSSNVIHEMEVIWLTIISASLKLSEGKLSIFQAKTLKRRSYPTFLSYYIQVIREIK